MYQTERKLIKADYNSVFGNYETYTVAEAIARLTKCEAGAISEGYTDIKVSIETSDSYYGENPSTTFQMSGQRFETEDEYNKRVVYDSRRTALENRNKELSFLVGKKEYDSKTFTPADEARIQELRKMVI